MKKEKTIKLPSPFTWEGCPKCGALYCPTCYRKTFGKCPCDQTPLEPR